MLTGNIIRCDRSEIEKLFNAGKRGTILATIFYASPMDDNKKWRKTGNTLHGLGILKECAVNGVIGYNYREAVRRMTLKEMLRSGKTEAECKAFVEALVFFARSWGVLREDRKFVDHTDKDGNKWVYVSMYVRSASTPVYRLGKEIVDSDKVTAFLSKSKKPSTQEHLDGEVIARDIRLDHILAIKYKGCTYIVDDLAPVTVEAQVLSAPKDPKLEAALKEMCDVSRLEQEGEILEEGDAVEKK